MSTEPVYVTIATALDGVLELFGTDGPVGGWLDYPNSSLGGRRPVDVIRDGDTDELAAAVAGLLASPHVS